MFDSGLCSYYGSDFAGQAASLGHLSNSPAVVAAVVVDAVAIAAALQIHSNSFPAVRY